MSNKSSWTTQPFAFLGGLGIVSLIDDLLSLHGWVQQWVDAWQAITRPIWDFTLGWLFALFDMTVPWFVADYLTVTAIAFGMIARLFFYEQRNLGVKPPRSLDDWISMLSIVASTFIWPLLWIYLIIIMIEKGRQLASSFITYFSTLGWAALIIAFSYALMFSGA